MATKLPPVSLDTSTPERCFEYEPLDTTTDSFRLVRILPSDGDDIYCELSDESHDAQENCYIGVSYSWGAESGDKAIHLNGSQFPVRENLYALLQCLRRQKVRDSLWIDAICIDQNSITEKNHQVAIMAKIYGSAAWVYAWLGEAADDSDWLFDTLSQSIDSEDPDRTFRGQPDRFYLALERFIDRVYWTRFWIVQELVLARDVKLLCGQSTLVWCRIEAFFIYHTIRFRLELTTISQIVDARSSAKNFEQLFYVFGAKNCSIMHDKIYALLGMSPRSATRFPIEYRISIFSLLYSAIVNWDLLDHDEGSTKLDFINRSLQNVPLNIQDCAAESIHASRPIGFELNFQGVIAELDFVSAKSRAKGFHLCKQQHGNDGPLHLYLTDQSTLSPRRDGVYYRLTSKFPRWGIVIRWPSPATPSSRHSKGEIIGLSVQCWELLNSDIKEINETVIQEFLSGIASDIGVYMSAEEVVSMEVGFYNFVRLAKFLSDKSEVVRQE